MLDRIADTAAAQSRPAGLALPPLLPSNIRVGTPEAHVDAARRRDPFAVCLEAATVWMAKWVATQCVNSPNEAIDRRAKAIEELGELVTRLGPLRKKRVANIPTDSPARGIHFPLISIIAKTYDYDDKQFSNDLSRGMSIVGHVEPQNGLTARSKGADSSVEAWRE